MKKLKLKILNCMDEENNNPREWQVIKLFEERQLLGSFLIIQGSRPELVPKLEKTNGEYVVYHVLFVLWWLSTSQLIRPVWCMLLKELYSANSAICHSEWYDTESTTKSSRSLMLWQYFRVWRKHQQCRNSPTCKRHSSSALYWWSATVKNELYLIDIRISHWRARPVKKELHIHRNWSPQIAHHVPQGAYVFIES